jgi:hypothetical protein
LRRAKAARYAKKTSRIECRVGRYLRPKIQRGILTASAQIARRAMLYETSLIKAPSRIHAPYKAAGRKILLI